MNDRNLLENYLTQWQLTAISPLITTATSLLQKAQDSNGDIFILKVTQDQDEIRGIQQLTIWSKENNPACVKVIKTANNAILLDYAQESRSLLPEALDETTHLSATEKLANNIYQLHQTALEKFDPLRSLNNVLDDLLILEHHSGLLLKAQKIAKALLISATSNVSPHGDAHHDNMLYFLENALRVIDPKGFKGEHYFDYLPIFINPDLGEIRMDLVLFESKLELLCSPHKGYLLERSRLIRWIYVGAALSAAWFLEDQMQSEAEQQLTFMQWMLDENFIQEN